jgi:hypothetical protein
VRWEICRRFVQKLQNVYKPSVDVLYEIYKSSTGLV